MRPVFTVAAVFAVAAPLGGMAGGRFETKLSPDQQILQALQRLTFGPRPGDADEVRRMGVQKWIVLQLHPDRIAEDPAIEAKLKPLDTLRMDSAQMYKQFFVQPPPGVVRIPNFNEVITDDQQRRKILNGTAEERRAALVALDADKRWQVLSSVPPNVLEGLPDLQEEAKAARTRRTEEQMKEARKLRPPLNELLNPQQVQTAQRGTWEQRKALFDSLDDQKRLQVASAMAPGNLTDFPELRRAAAVSRTPRQIPLADLREAKLYRAVLSKRQLQEVLVDFWFNHFNVFEGKGPATQLSLTAYENQAIRPHVLGKFKDLLLATARHPAMLYYLDNWQSMGSEQLNIGPFAQMGPALSRIAHGLNENYGRELLELHTMGVKGGYTQADVVAVARCFTGWTIRDPQTKPEYVFAPFMHDPGEKVVLGHKIAAGGGEQDALQVIEILSRHPATARFISRKLAQRFVADDPPPALVERMAKVFLKTDGDLRAVMQVLFTSREFFSQDAWQTKVKSPLEMIASAVRASGAQTNDTFLLVQRIGELGEPLYSKLEPTGYKDSAEIWLSSAAVLARINFANQLGVNGVPGIKLDLARFRGKDAAAIAREVLNRDASPQTLAAIEKGMQGKPANPGPIIGLLMSSPEFQRR